MITKTNNEKIILGIDPGTNIMGYGIISVVGSKVSLITMDVVNMKKTENQALKLKQIFDSLIVIIKQYLPDEVAIESPFLGQNIQSALKLGRAQGVAMAAALSCGIPIVEYSPKKVKQAITGNGNADKEQVAYMLRSILKFEEIHKYFDATDGLALAYCHYLQKGVPAAKGKASWSKFVTENPTKVLKT